MSFRVPLESPIRRVAVVMAMDAEAGPLREALEARPVALAPWTVPLPCRVFAAPATGRRPEVLLAVNGTDPRTGVDCIGSTAAALTTHVVLSTATEPVDLVLSVGTAGGWDRCGAAIGDVFLASDRFVCHDRRIDLPGFDRFGRGELPAVDLRAAAETLGFRLGTITTGDSLDESPTDRDRILASGAEVKEMEAAAVAWIAHLHGRPVSALKVITDLVDSPVSTPDQFTANLAAASAVLHGATIDLLEYLGGAR